MQPRHDPSALPPEFLASFSYLPVGQALVPLAHVPNNDRGENLMANTKSGRSARVGGGQERLDKVRISHRNPDPDINRQLPLSSEADNTHKANKAYTSHSDPDADIDITILPGGLRASRQCPGIHDGGGKRGPITGFSSASRRHLELILASLDFNTYSGYSVCLTFSRNTGTNWRAEALTASLSGVNSTSKKPRSYVEVRAEDIAQAKACVNRWRSRFLRRYGDDDPFVVWIREFQRRGTIHYHLLVLWPVGQEPDDAEFREWVHSSWNEVVAPGDNNHLKYGAHVVPTYNTSGPGRAKFHRYFAKYASKVLPVIDPDTGEILSTGRVWDVWGELKGDPLAKKQISEHEYAQLCRRLRRWGRESRRYVARLTVRWNGFLIGYDGALIEQLLRGLECEMIVTPDDAGDTP